MISKHTKPKIVNYKLYWNEPKAQKNKKQHLRKCVNPKHSCQGNHKEAVAWTKTRRWIEMWWRCFVCCRELLLNNNLLRVLPYELGRLFQLQTLGLKGDASFTKPTYESFIWLILCWFVVVSLQIVRIFFFFSTQETRCPRTSSICTRNQTEPGSFWTSCWTISQVTAASVARKGVAAASSVWWTRIPVFSSSSASSQCTRSSSPKDRGSRWRSETQWCPQVCSPPLWGFCGEATPSFHW